MVAAELGRPPLALVVSGPVVSISAATPVVSSVEVVVEVEPVATASADRSILDQFDEERALLTRRSG